MVDRRIRLQQAVFERQSRSLQGPDHSHLRKTLPVFGIGVRKRRGQESQLVEPVDHRCHLPDLLDQPAGMHRTKLLRSESVFQALDLTLDEVSEWNLSSLEPGGMT